MKPPKYVGDGKVRSLLETAGCPVPFHVVRVRFMGNIASPIPEASPLRLIEDLWPEGLPDFQHRNEVNHLLGALMGLWNHLAKHQKRSKPFKLTRQPRLATRADIAEFLAVRCQEIEGFLDGLYDGRESLDLPDAVIEELDSLAESFAVLSGTRNVAGDETVPGTSADVTGLIGTIRDVDPILTTQLNAIIQGCVAFRREMLAANDTEPHTVH
jgi:hypothetical protein|tara:strand:+ start:553 stop:1191 length:639 start_codon:yes stop_codon:yes gene_type:complete